MVVLPDPLGPTSTSISPWRTSSDTSRSALDGDLAHLEGLADPLQTQKDVVGDGGLVGGDLRHGGRGIR